MGLGGHVSEKNKATGKYTANGGPERRQDNQENTELRGKDREQKICREVASPEKEVAMEVS